MARNRLILCNACVLLILVCQAVKADLEHLNATLQKLDKQHGSLQNEINAIWATLIMSGLETQDYGNRTRTDNFGTNAKEFMIKLDGTLTSIQGLKTDVNHLIMTSRDGLKHEKSWQREALSKLTNVFDNFQTGVTEKNLDLQQTIRHIQENNQQKLSSIETENREVKSMLVEVQKDNQKIRNDFEVEKQTLKQTVNEMRNDYEQMRTELDKLQATTLTTTTTTAATATLPESLLLLCPCDEDWKSFNDHCYLIVREWEFWEDASAFCDRKNSYLMEITTDAELEFATELLREHSLSVWIGATDTENEGTFVYQRSKQQVPEKYWRTGQPDNYHGVEHCAKLMDYDETGHLEVFDYLCDSYGTFVCEYSPIWGMPAYLGTRLN